MCGHKPFISTALGEGHRCLVEHVNMPFQNYGNSVLLSDPSWLVGSVFWSTTTNVLEYRGHRLSADLVPDVGPSQGLDDAAIIPILQMRKLTFS